MTLETDSMFITYLLAVYLNFSIVTYVGDKHLLPYGSVFFFAGCWNVRDGPVPDRGVAGFILFH